MSNIWFTSDLHFYHSNVIRYCDRPFKDVETMNEILIRNWNEVVMPEDTIYCLGDFSLAIRPVELYTQRLNGIKILITGNHDWCSKANKKSRTSEKLLDNRKLYYDYGWNEIHDSLSIDIDGQEVLLCHFPYEGDSGPTERFSSHRVKNEGKWLLHGHTHSKEKIKDRMIHVGVDAWDYKPVNIEKIKELMK